MRTRSRPQSWLIVALTVAVALSAWTGLAFGSPAAHPALARAAPALGVIPVAPAAPPLPAVGGPQWINLTPLENGTAPAGSADAAMAYDPLESEWVYFGGCTVLVCPINDTWVYANGGWRNVTDPARAPPARYGATMDYDANAGGILLFGGIGTSATFLNDTWLFQGCQWTNVDYLGPAPPARLFANMVFDPESATNGSVLFGGCIGIGFSIGCFNDTWVWQPGAGWTELKNVTAPPVRGAAMMAYDPVDRYAVLYGGFGNCPSGFCYYHDTWEFYSGTWWPLNATSVAGPPARDSAVMTFDQALGGTLMFGGYNETMGTPLGDTWLFHGGAWTQISPSSGPSIRYHATMSVDSSGVPPLLFGGYAGAGGVTVGDTWVYETPPSVAISGLSGSVEVGGTAPTTVTAGGGSGPYSVIVNFGDGSAGGASGAGPTFAFPHAWTRTANVTVTANLSDFVGEPATAAQALKVVAGPTIVATAGMGASDTGISVSFTAQPGSGSSSLTGYVWTFGDGTNASGANVTHAFAHAGEFEVAVTASDSTGAPADAQLMFPVAAVPSATIVANPTQPTAGSAAGFLATVGGGSAPLHYAWLFGDGSTTGLPSPSHVYAAAGTFLVQLWVNDSAGATSHASATIVVVAPTGGSPGPASTTSSAIPSWYWIAIAGIVIATVVVAGLLIATRRKPGT
ncbi:MAG: PKD domain-containing protein [Thermoplasmata archaeon]|nr:PKD domain-containing protein [Thermoplasmata archaeon]